MQPGSAWRSAAGAAEPSAGVRHRRRTRPPGRCAEVPRLGGAAQHADGKPSVVGSALQSVAKAAASVAGAIEMKLHPHNGLQHGDIVIAVIDGELTIKRLEKRRGRIRLVAENPACGDIPTTVPTQEIVTEASDAGTLAPMTVDEVLATFDEEQIAEVGGPACARQMAVIISGAEQFLANEGVDPETIEDVERAGYLAEPVTMWQVVDDELRPTDDSPCNDFFAADR